MLINRKTPVNVDKVTNNSRHVVTRYAIGIHKKKTVPRI